MVILGRVAVHGLYNNERISALYKRPMKAVKLNADYVKRPTIQYIAGGMAGEVLMSEKTLFGSQETVLQKNCGAVYNIQWVKSLATWANDVGVFIHDLKQPLKCIGTILRPKECPRSDIYRCHLRWCDGGERLLVGWADSVRIAHFNPARKLFEVLVDFKTNFFVAGIAPLIGVAGDGGDGGAELVILAVLDNLPEPESYDHFVESVAEVVGGFRTIFSFPIACLVSS